MEGKKILDFKCTYDNSAGIGRSVTEGLGLTFPDAYLHADTMVLLSRALKEHDGGVFCELPFCHTVEAEAMGGIINMGNEIAGPRAKEYICTKMEEILELPPIDFETGRIHEVLLACQKLREEGEHVVMEVSGPFTILNVLIDAKYVFKCLRKNPELAMKVFWKLGEEVFLFMEEAKKYGAEFISYADSSGGVNILGPKMAEQVVEGFTYEYLKKVERLADDHTMILLCPKTTFALLGTEKAVFRDIPLNERMLYSEACMKQLGKVKFGGMMCVKNVRYEIGNGVFKEVVLK
ncbi:MAG: uroporphyrinogen decarboxylase family protein [Eubacteriales bacterium]|nr:uroporphyrinogen decarboxylase family protein [Eubacteriales bacterium]